jgi:hypothetical protein
MPILPEHIYGKFDYKKIADQKFDPPLVGSRPVHARGWKTGQFARFVRNRTTGATGLRRRGGPALLPDATDVMVRP